MRGVILLLICFGSVAYAEATETAHLEETSPLAYLRRDDPFFERAAAEFGYCGGPWTINQLSHFRSISKLDTPARTYASSHRHHHVLYCPRIRNHTLIYPSTTVGSSLRCNTGPVTIADGYEYTDNATTGYRESDTDVAFSNVQNIDVDAAIKIIKGSGSNASTDHIIDIDTINAKNERHDDTENTFIPSAGDQLHMDTVSTNGSDAIADIDRKSNIESATSPGISGSVDAATDTSYAYNTHAATHSGIKAESNIGVKIGDMYYDDGAIYTTNNVDTHPATATDRRPETDSTSHTTNNFNRNAATDNHHPAASVPLFDIVTDIGRASGSFYENTPTVWETGSGVKGSSGVGDDNLPKVPPLTLGLTGSDPGRVLKYCEENIDFLQKLCCNTSSLQLNDPGGITKFSEP